LCKFWCIWFINTGSLISNFLHSLVFFFLILPKRISQSPIISALSASCAANCRKINNCKGRSFLFCYLKVTYLHHDRSALLIVTCWKPLEYVLRSTTSHLRYASLLPFSGRKSQERLSIKTRAKRHKNKVESQSEHN